MIMDGLTVAGIAVFVGMMGVLYGLRWCRKRGSCAE